MLNFLPTKNRKKVALEYMLRGITLLSILVSSVSVLLVALFVPSAIFSKYKYNNVVAQLASTQATYKNGGGEDPIAAIHQLNRMVPIFSEQNAGSLSMSDLIEKAIALKNSGVMITSISVSIADVTGVRTVSINGMANTRDSLTAFNNSLKGEQLFSNVSLPVQDLISDTQAQFSITLTYHPTN